MSSCHTQTTNLIKRDRFCEKAAAANVTLQTSDKLM